MAEKIERLKRGHETIYRIIRQLKKESTVFEILLQYQGNKGNCGRKKIKLPDSEVRHINRKVQEDWTPMLSSDARRGLFPEYAHALSQV